jgi:NAD(P)-dependent dehydrogenase (short-subunit alcohol dehydrogenase family)
MAGDMKGKVALVTGGGSGIGRGTALAFAGKGVRVAVVDIVPEGANLTVSMIKEAGGEAVAILCDVAKSAQVKAMVDKTIETFGRLDYAFNNAGIEGMIAPLSDYDEDAWNHIIAVNLTGVWLCMKYEIPALLKQGGGAIVNTASVAGHIGTPGASGYTATKHGVIGLTKTVALEYATSGIRVNSLCPGAIRTEMWEIGMKKYPHMEQFFRDAHPVGRIGEVNEVAGAVIWMCSDEASFMTGTSMIIDGGVTAR